MKHEILNLSQKKIFQKLTGFFKSKKDTKRMPIQSSNTRDTFICGECGMNCVGAENKVKLWYKLHFKQNHPNVKMEKMEKEDRHYGRPSRRGNFKAEYELKQNTLKIPPSDIFTAN